MSQHDFTIGNQLFPDTRTDLNNALVALASNSSGSAEPSTTYANQWWYETDTNTLKIRNEANSAWISVAVLDQTSNNVLSINTQGLTISNLTLSSTAVTATGAELNKLSGTSVTSGELDILSGVSVTSAELNKLSGANVTTAELNKLSGANVTTAELDILSGATVTTAELNKLSGANVTTAELNKLSGTNVTTAELDKLSAMTSSTTELNQLDDITRGSIIYGDSVGTARLAKGTDGQVLTATATDINWETPSVSDPAAIISSGGSSPTPSLATGITAGEVRTLIGAGVSSSDTTYSIQDGELSENNFTNADHSKLDNIEANANNYVHPTGNGSNHIPSGGASGQILGYASGGTAQWQSGVNFDANRENILLGFDPDPDFDIDASSALGTLEYLEYARLEEGVDTSVFENLLGIEAPWTDTTIKHHYKIVKGSSVGAQREKAGSSSDFGDTVVFGNVHSDGTNYNITTGMTINGGHLRLIAAGEADHSATGFSKFTIDTGDVEVTGLVDGRDIATNIPAALGTAGQVLKVNSAANATEWGDASGGGVGVSQSWQTNTMNGQNTEGEPIMVFSRFNGYGNTASFQVSSNNSTWLTLATSEGYTESGDSFAGARVTVSAIIPDDHYWRITGSVGIHSSAGGPNINMVLK